MVHGSHPDAVLISENTSEVHNQNSSPREAPVLEPKAQSSDTATISMGFEESNKYTGQTKSEEEEEKN